MGRLKNKARLLSFIKENLSHPPGILQELEENYADLEEIWRRCDDPNVLLVIIAGSYPEQHQEEFRKAMWAAGNLLLDKRPLDDSEGARLFRELRDAPPRAPQELPPPALVRAMTLYSEMANLQELPSGDARVASAFHFTLLGLASVCGDTVFISGPVFWHAMKMLMSLICLLEGREEGSYKDPEVCDLLRRCFPENKVLED